MRTVFLKQGLLRINAESAIKDSQIFDVTVTQRDSGAQGMLRVMNLDNGTVDALKARPTGSVPVIDP
jgi:hypothetical protein